MITLPYQIPFHDVDSLNIVWHGHYYKYFELARTALYRSVEFDVDAMKTLGMSFPVIESQCRYPDSLRYGQEINISANFQEWEYYIRIDYQISDATTEKRVAYGYTKQVACSAEGSLHSSIPKSVTDIITGHQTKNIR
ncbi:MAG TPA: acyl-CoA thioesterase [Alphaproteobacteria bacterium]|jgi:acyl-CoA thioester hydrolase|nr:acyl-CoA thioesterase [Chromatiaceae bacterium]HIN92445.1 acyl-CoA thioesterase [Alphaproteobacteria bacterium]HIO50928.1 acyl-CoA thioesterase [Candidatus Poribacteria bacterium]